MGLHQDFRFHYESTSEVQSFLRSLSGIAKVDDRGEFFVFSEHNGQPFLFDCELHPFGLRTNRGGEYFQFLGHFVEALTGHFGPVEVEDT